MRAALRELSLVFDVETTGLDPKRDRIVEIGLIATDWADVYAVLHTYVDPGFDFGHNEHSGIAYTDCLGAPSFAWLLCNGLYMLFLASEEYCAYSAKFDLSFLRAECALAELRLPNRPVRDPLAVMRCTLQQACATRGVYTEDVKWHSALGDATATYRLLRKLRQDRQEDSGGSFSIVPRFS